MNRPSSANLPSVGLGETRSLEPDSRSALEAALATLKTGDFHSRWDAAKAFPAFGAAAIAPLLDLLQSEAVDETELPWFIARILGNLKHPAAVDSLIRVLQSTEQPEVTAVAAVALANYGTAAIAPLTALLSQPATRLVAVQALAQIQQPIVIQPLLTVVNDAAAEVRAAAIEALSHFYDPAITVALQSALQDSHTIVRRAAVVALGIQADQGDRQTLTEMLSPLLADLNLEVSRQASIALGRLGTDTAIAVLAQELQSAYTPLILKLDIVQALVWIGTAAALAPLRQFLACPNSTNFSANFSASFAVEQAIITALGRVEPEAQPVASQILLDLLQAHHPVAQTAQGQQYIARSLGQLRDPRSIPALIMLLSEPSAGVQLHAIAALKQLEAAGSYQQLQSLATAALSPDLKAGIATALQEWQAHTNGNG